MKNIFALSPDKEAENILYTTGKLMRLLHVKVTATTLKNTLLSHPYYLSLFSITESLQQWKVETTALQISETELDEISCPFIAYLPSGRKFITIEKITSAYIYYYDERNKRLAYPRKDFINAWDGVVLLAEPTEESGEPAYKNAFRKEFIHQLKIPLLFFTFLIASVFKIYDTIYVLHQPLAAYFSLLAVCKLMGLFIASLLLLYEYDDQNSFLKQICSAGKKTNCAAVLSSKWSKAAGRISWSEAGFIYFFGGWLLLITTGIAVLPVLYLLNILAIPFIILSIYYQAFKIKQWCVLCITVQSLLVIELLGGFFTYRTNILLPASLLTISTILTLLLSFFLPAFIWFFTRPFIYQAKEKTALQYQLARFKNSPDVFYNMLQKQPAVNGTANGLGITIGNPNAENTLIKVCNPYCGPCAKAHPKIEALIQNNSNWKVQIIFSAKANEDEMKYAAVSHLMAIAETNNVEKKQSHTREALDEWYKPAKTNGDRLLNFTSKYPVNNSSATQESSIDAMYAWCQENAIKFTPTFFVNGYRLPEQYEITDLQYL